MMKHSVEIDRRTHVPFSQGACPCVLCDICEAEAVAELGIFSTQKIDEAELAASMARHPAGKGKQSNQSNVGRARQKQGDMR